MLLTSFLEGEFITCRQYCESLGVNYRLDLLLEVDFYLLHVTCFLLFCRRWDVTTRSYSKCYWQPSKICTRPSPRSNRRGEAGTPLSARPKNSSQSRLSVTPRNHCFKNVELLPVDPNILWQVLLWIRQLGVVRQWQWCCVFVVYCRDSCNVLLFQIFSWWTWCNKYL